MEQENVVFARRAGYTGLVITDPAVRPGILLDRLEQALQLVDESRARQEGMSPVPGVVPPMAASATKEPTRPTRRIRLPVHREVPRAVPDPELIEAERIAARGASAPIAPPSAPLPPVDAPPRRRNEESVEEPSENEADTPVRGDEPPERKTAKAAKPGSKGRRGLGEYVGKQAKGGGKSPASRMAPEAEVEAPSRKREKSEAAAEEARAEEARAEKAHAAVRAAKEARVAEEARAA
jgi:hypothetical protein